MFSTSMTMGAMATTRLSAAAVSQVVQPRLEAPETTKRLIAFSLLGLHERLPWRPWRAARFLPWAAAGASHLPRS